MNNRQQIWPIRLEAIQYKCDELDAELEVFLQSGLY